MGIRADFTGAVRKTNTLAACMPELRRQATKWSSETVRDLKKSAAAMQKSLQYPGGKHTSQLMRNIGMKVLPTSQLYIAIGTGLMGTQETKYARIQDEGGTTHPTVTPKMRRWAWAMYKKSKGMDKYKGIALTKQEKLTVKIPASRWFTSVIEEREPILLEMMDPEVVWNLASQRAGGKG